MLKYFVIGILYVHLISYVLFLCHRILSPFTLGHSYVDPLGESPERPKTAARQKPADEDEFKTLN